MVMRRRDLSKVFNYELECLPPYSFDLTVNKRTRFSVNWYWITPYETYHKGVTWSGIRLHNDKPVGLKVKATGSLQKPKVLLEVFPKLLFQTEKRRK